MKAKTLFRYTKPFVAFIMLFLWNVFSLNAQCPTVTNPTPSAICDASGYTFSDLSGDFATDNGGGIFWYDNATGGAPYNATQLVAEGTYYADDNTESCISRPFIIIDFQVDPSGRSLDGIYCSNENPTVQTYIDDVLQANIPSGGSVEVYNDFALTSLASGTDPLSTGATNYFIVFLDSSSCKSQIEIGSTAMFDAPSDPTPTTPQPFCSDSNPTIAELDPGTTETNYSWYSALDGSGDPIQPALSPTTLLVNGNTYYIQLNGVFCVSNPVAVVVDIDVPVEPGTPASIEYCNDSLPASDFNLFDELGGIPDSTGSWTGPLTTSNGYLGTVNISTLTTAGTYVFTYTVPSTGFCPDGIATVTFTVYETFSSGTPSTFNPASFCEASLPASFDLFTLLESEDPNGQWTQGTTSTDPVVSSPIDLTGFTTGTYNFTYTQNLAPNSCPEDSTTVQVIVLQDPNAGVAVNQMFCENELAANSPFDLFDALDGSQDSGGVWTDASTASVSNSIDITSFTVTGSPYQYTYTVDNGTCTDDEAITITILPAPESGTPVATFPEFCEGAAPASFDLFTLLDNENQTGTWFIGNDNTGATTVNPIDLSGLTPATYDFTFEVNPIGSCEDVLVTVSVTINPLPITGTPMSATFCENDLATNSPLDLFGQLTGEDAGGTWSDDNTSGALTGSDVDLTLLTIGSYNYTYSITDANGCSNSSTVTVIVEDAPESGTPVATFPEFCEGAAPASFDLFTLIDNEEPTGTWFIGSDNTGATTTNPVDLSVLTMGSYDFTFEVNPIGSCEDVLVTVSVTINPLPITGTPTSATFCENDLAINSPLDLFGQLTGEDVGGTWSDDNTSGALTGSDVDLTLLTIGSYNYTYNITDANGCSNNSTVTIIVVDAPESGTPNLPVEFCLAEITAAQTYNLFDLLTDEDQPGTWNDDDSTGLLSGNIITLDGLAAGTYNFTYDVDAIGTCDDVDVTVSIIINDTPAPIASSPQEFCDTATVADLVATGTTIQWYDVSTGGTPLTGTTSLVDAQIYYATQTDATTGCESFVRTEVTVTIYISPNAGEPSTTPIVACNDNNNINLFTGLNGTEDAGGIWQDTDGTGALTGNIFDGTVVSAGTYQFTYLVTASAPCVDDSTLITVTIEEPLNAGTDNVLDVCSNNGTTDLFTLIGSANAGGTWSPTLTSGTGVFDPLVDPDGTYTYTLTNACGTYTSEVIVTVTLAPNAGADASAAICMIDGPTDLFPSLGAGAQSGGIWSPALTSGTGVFDPALDTAGVYTYTVAAVAPCSPDSTADITVSVNDSPTIIVNDANPEFCMADSPTVADLADSIRPTGTVKWYEDAALTIPLLDTDTLVDGEDYYATQTTSSGCESSTAVQINVTINDTATPTLLDSSAEYCINDGPTISDLSLNITEYNASSNNVLWYDSAIGGSTISSSTTLTNTTYYAVLVDPMTGCESSVRLAITPDVTACGKLQIPDGFSPNGDGTNDTFDVDNLAILYPNFEMEIYNRNGNIVYKGNANSPRFDGISNQSKVVSGGDLPVGVYFYIFNFNDGVNKPEQGRLYLSR
jgi:gliding motility-associated-like protein